MARLIRITDSLFLDEGELLFDFVRASGPGGQKVNKVATAVQVRFDVAGSPSLPDDVKARLTRTAGSRMTNDGHLLLSAQRYRTQGRNRQDATERLVALIRSAAAAPRKRRKTRRTKGSQERRLKEKKARGEVKRTRTRPDV